MRIVRNDNGEIVPQTEVERRYSQEEIDRIIAEKLAENLRIEDEEEQERIRLQRQEAERQQMEEEKKREEEELVIPDYFEIMDPIQQEFAEPPKRAPRVVWILRNGVSDYDQKLIDHFKAYGWKLDTFSSAREADAFMATHYVHCAIAGAYDVSWLVEGNSEFNIQRMLWSASISKDPNRLRRYQNEDSIDVLQSEEEFKAGMKILYKALGGKVRKEKSKPVVIKTKLESYDQTYKDIVHKMSNNWDSGNHGWQPRLKSIHLNNHQALDAVLEAYEKDRYNRMRLWMGISKDRLRDITKHGFSNDDMQTHDFGRGLYLTTSASKAYNFAKNDFGANNVVLLLCDCALGSRYDVTSRDYNNGYYYDDAYYNHHHRNYNRKPSFSRISRSYDTLYVSSDTRYVNKDQYVVYDVSRVMPRFTIRFYK